MANQLSTAGSHDQNRSARFTLWRYKDVGLLSWSENLVEIGSGSPEKIFEYISLLGGSPFVLPKGEDICVFREEVVPMWEDPINAKGGRWRVQLTDEKLVNEMFFRSLMAFFERALTDEHWTQVTGLYFQRKGKGGILALWMSDVRVRDATYRLGDIWKNILSTKNVVLDYF
ncbi:eukaryotic translation initiation factor 4E-like [Tropilaelaps mercedesae]|uniref:eIF-4F 25 kDa subunit n=1 Tax=Tropilaelaps mercedesae TaxID=418985 RepID=A0A1V9Y2Y1_9ACAR|nr:eukaryotic translation initiation factor 4E-like [Tropilaelaps mercedesae]